VVTVFKWLNSFAQKNPWMIFFVFKVNRFSLRVKLLMLFDFSYHHTYVVC
jgi:hypothetical protein